MKGFMKGFVKGFVITAMAAVAIFMFLMVLQTGYYILDGVVYWESEIGFTAYAQITMFLMECVFTKILWLIKATDRNKDI